MNFKTNIPVSISLLKEFVYEAKKQSFAKTDDKTTLTNQTSVYSFRPFNSQKFKGMIYTDMFNGNTIEGGQESVSIDLSLRWINHYYGGTKISFWDISRTDININLDKLDDTRFPEVITSFLKQALLRMPDDFPVRGPKQYSTENVAFENNIIEGDWQYNNRWKSIPTFNLTDPFASFVGEESIKYNGIEVYWHAYHGGLIRDKYFPIIIEK